MNAEPQNSKAHSHFYYLLSFFPKKEKGKPWPSGQEAKVSKTFSEPLPVLFLLAGSQCNNPTA